MGIAVNGIDVTDAEIAAEMAHHANAANPLKQAVHEVVLRRVLLDEADRLGIVSGDASDDERIETLFACEVQVPEVDDLACRRYYDAHKAAFTRGELVEARHILFQVTPEAPLELLRETATLILEELRHRPERFEELAKRYSNCPSGAVGGSLGQLKRGDCVPEFDAVLFRLAAGELAGRLVETRFGLHIVQVQRRLEGTLLPFDSVREQVADTLRRESWQRALHQYLHVLVGRAKIEGVELEGAESPLVQ
ncbi:peptidyl-prolyl cis-trans isomerase C [Pseudoduganella flava]|uniref:peptidylprolyl isomerase n=1 Tax=Pseudoduganella flava TaxID=871742 RepID=A0A562PBL7_9BURK|nr:peptidylprolyl isomerase [Pseudoduganella flava]QGZ37980.1 peptidylprolyl isomerase [Pseudoduganella flava]TWI41801.1 peptidyl-prolyl cis-trans isomerase C [Pseudoduganella flava]